MDFGMQTASVILNGEFNWILNKNIILLITSFLRPGLIHPDGMRMSVWNAREIDFDEILESLLDVHDWPQYGIPSHRDIDQHITR